MSSNYKDIEKTLKEFERTITDIKKLSLNVGIPKEISVNNKDENNKIQYVADIAFQNNFGSFSKKIPARPFGSTVVERRIRNIEKLVNDEFYRYLTKKQSLIKAFNRIGIKIAGYMQHNIIFGNWKANAPLTIAKKGSSKPLIDTGQMRQSITYIVKDSTKNE